MGVFLYSSSFNAENTNNPQLAELEASLKSCEEKIANVSEKLKSLEALDNSKSADDVLAEMMKIFVADWGLKIKFANLKKETPGADLAKCEISTPTTTAIVPPAFKSQPDKKHEEVSKLEIPRGLEVNIVNAASEEESFRLAERLKTDEMFKLFSSTQSAKLQDIVILEGKFRGEVRPSQGAKKPTDIEMEIEIRKRKNPPEGVFTLTESVDGRRISRSSGRGQFKNLSSLSGSKALYVERNGGDNIMHLYYVSALDSLVGNDYARVSKTKLEYSGQVFLKRSN